MEFTLPQIGDKKYNAGDVVVRKNKNTKKDEAFLIASYETTQIHYCSIFLGNMHVSVQGYTKVEQVIQSLEKNGDIIAHYSKEEYYMKMMTK
jgi:predicted solute-binding protein